MQGTSLAKKINVDTDFLAIQGMSVGNARYEEKAISILRSNKMTNESGTWVMYGVYENDPLTKSLRHISIDRDYYLAKCVRMREAAEKD